MTSDTATLFADATEVPARRQRLTRVEWTWLGALAIPLWATWPSLAIRTLMVPPLETLGVMFFFGWITFALLARAQGRPEPADKPSWVPGLVYAAALSGGDVCFLLATQRISPAEANLICYLWPVLIVLFGAAAGLFRLRARQSLGLLLGFSGAAILFWDGHATVSLSGIVLALLSGALWAGYCVFRLMWKAPAGNLLAQGCGISTLVCGALHFAFEPTVMPTPAAFACMTIAGVLPLAVGNHLWDVGFRRGDSQQLAVMAYATPLCGALLLAALGAAVLTWNLLLGAIVIVAAGVLSRSDQLMRSGPHP
jgi:prepilin-type processing-associated H-X9-DG protein